MYGHLKLKFEEHLAASCSGGKLPQAVSLRLEFPCIRSESSHNLFVSTSIENTIHGFVRAIEADLSSGFEVCNLADGHVEPRIVNIQDYLKKHWPDVPNESTGNQGLLSIERARKTIGYNPTQRGNYLSPVAAWR